MLHDSITRSSAFLYRPGQPWSDAVQVREGASLRLLAETARNSIAAAEAILSFTTDDTSNQNASHVSEARWGAIHLIRLTYLLNEEIFDRIERTEDAESP